MWVLNCGEQELWRKQNEHLSRGEARPNWKGYSAKEEEEEEYFYPFFSEIFINFVSSIVYL
jgi:hypothetical protein